MNYCKLAVLTILLFGSLCFAHAESIADGSLAPGSGEAGQHEAHSAAGLGWDAAAATEASGPGSRSDRSSVSASEADGPNPQADLLADDIVVVLLDEAVMAPASLPGAVAPCALVDLTCDSPEEVNLASVNMFSGMDTDMFTFQVGQADAMDGSDPSGMGAAGSLVQVVDPHSNPMAVLGLSALGGTVLLCRWRSIL